MNDSPDPNRTLAISGAPADSLDAGLAAGFGLPMEAPRSSLPDMRPVLLKEAEADSGHAVQPSSDAVPPPEQTGTRYQLQGEIARGGMGAVLRGRDVDLGRDLAVKVLLEKYVGRPEVARRFIEEAQIGGQLQHPGVVPVYDIGRFGDRPFFTMKLVKGHTLAALLSERSEPGADKPRFLAVALQVCQAVAYAHAKGVIHRDLKPANIMVGAFGEVQVMDWGLAKVLSEGGIADEERASRERQRPEDGTQIRTARSVTGFGTETEAGSLLGTPAYMPPEQANGDVANLDRRADVFGLGAILCEVLTGEPPYVGRSSEEVRRKAANGDLGDAHARLDGCGADAELIVLTKACLYPEAIDRPRDAQAVAEALTAYLDGVQERLHQAELAEAEAKAKAIEEAKRRRLTLALAGTVLLAVTLGGGAWLWVKADSAARQAQVTRDVNDALNQATALREKAKAARAGAALFAQAREQAQRALALVETGPVDVALQRQVRQLQTMLDQEEKDRRLIAALDAARLIQAETVVRKNRFADEQAVPRFRDAFAAYGLPAGEGNPAAAAARIRERPASVREAVNTALDEWIDLTADPTYGITEPHLDWLRAVAADADEGWARAIRTALAEKDRAKRQTALEKLAREAGVEKRPARALTRLAKQLLDVQAGASAVRLLRRAQERYPGDFWVNHDLGMALRRGNPPELEAAVRYLTAAVALRPDSSGAHLNLGKALQTKGQLDEAIACYRQAIALTPQYAPAHNNLGTALNSQEKVEESIACFRKAIALDPKCAPPHHNLGRALHRQGQLDEAIVHYRQALALEPRYAAAHNNLGLALRNKGLLEEAIVCYRAALDCDPTDSAAHSNLGLALMTRGRPDEAIACFRKALAIDPKLVGIQASLGFALAATGDSAEACKAWQRSVALQPNQPEVWYWIARAHSHRGHRDQATVAFRRVRELYPAGSERRWEAEQFLGGNDLDGRLVGVLRGTDQPANPTEAIWFARECLSRKSHRIAAGLYAAAFTAEPKLAGDPRAGHRYNAACAALLAATEGKDAAQRDATERARLRKQALEWLRADLAWWTRFLDSGPPAARIVVQETLRHWQQDSDLAGLRDKDALARLAAAEQKSWTQLWANVTALLKEAESPVR
jgi:serine/threonine-protein kinase